MFELVSVHIPKCGGASLGRILERRYGWRLHLEYPAPVYPWDRRLRSTIRRSLRNILPPRAIHGHFPASKYQGREMMVVIRDPLEIRISRYHYARRMHDRFRIIANDDWRDAIKLDLIEYISLPFPDLSQFLDIPRERFSFVGRMDHFEKDMRHLSEWLSVPYTEVKINTNPDGRYEIQDDWRRRYEVENASEVALYRRFTE